MPKNLHRQIKGMLEDKSDKLNLISGELGIQINGQKTVEVSGRLGYVWVRLRGSQSELIQAYNASVSPIYDLPVLVIRQGNKYAIYGRDIERYDNWGATPYLPKHGTQHSFAPELGLGGDVTWVYSKQIMPMLAMPSGTAGAGLLVVGSFVYRDFDGTWEFIGDAGTDNILLAKPTNNQARMMTLYWDLDASNTGMITGSLFDASITGTSYIIPYLPEVSNNRQLPIAGVRLVSGTSVIGWDNIYDLRQLFATAANTSGIGLDTYWVSGSAGAYSITTRNGTNDSRGIQAFSHGEGTLALGIASHSEGVSTVASGSYSHAEGENSSALGWASHVAGGYNEVRGAYSAIEAGLNHLLIGENSSIISGDGLTGTVDNVGYTDRFNVHRLFSGTAIANVGIDSQGFLVTGTAGGAASPPVTGSIVVRDEGVTQGSATILDFVGANVDASISGTVARIFVTGSAGGDTLWQAGSAGTGSIRPVLGSDDATKNYAFAVGLANNAAGISSMAAGGSNSVSGSYSNVFGYINNVLGDASSILAGQANRLIGTNSSIVSGNGITGSADNTAYMGFANVQQLGNNASIANVGIDSGGVLVTGSAYSIQLAFTHGGNVGTPLSSTRYLGFYDLTTGQVTVEYNLQVTRAGKLRNLYVNTNSAQDASGSLVFTIYKNSGSTALTTTVSAGAGAGEFSDTTHIIDLAQGDYFTLQIVNNATATGAQIIRCSVEMNFPLLS